MKKVMIIAYSYPPKLSVGGLRITEFEKYLPQFGWVPIIHTTKVRNKREKNEIKSNIYRSYDIKLNRVSDFLDSLIRLPFKLSKIKISFYNIAKEFIFIPDDKIGWIIPCFFKGIMINKKKNYNLIYVSCKPFSAAITGVMLKKFLRKKLIIDYRDSFFLNRNKDRSPFYKIIIKKLERYLLKNCDTLITNTKSMETLYKKYYPNLEIKTIYNGFAFVPKDTYKKNDKMVICHVGNFYFNRTPDLLFRAMKGLGLKDITFRNVGGNLGEDRFYLVDFIKKYRLYKQVEILGYVPNNTALQIQQNSDVLFIANLGDYNRKDNPQIATKTFEYLVTGRPIIADMPEGDNTELIRKYSKNSYIITNKDINEMKSALLDLYSKWKKDELRGYRNSEFLQKFNRRNLTCQLAEVFNEHV